VAATTFRAGSLICLDVAPLSTRFLVMPNTVEVEEYYLTVFLAHGKDTAWREIADYIEQKLAHEVVPYAGSLDAGRADISQLETLTEECAFAIVMVTAAEDNSRSRQRILHEIGFCQGTFGRENVLIMKEEGADEFADFGGFIYVPYASGNVKSALPRIQAEIDAAIDRFEDEDELDDDED
jgi:predicted nucleotide-binding protein